MIKALFKFAKHNEPQPVVDIDTTSSSNSVFKELSPFILRIPFAVEFNPHGVIFENLWQYSKVYLQHVNKNGFPNAGWFKWREAGLKLNTPVRYPMGKGVKAEYSYWNGERLSYVEARKAIYVPIYSKYVGQTSAFKRLQSLYTEGQNIILRDYDAYDHVVLGMTLKDVINNPDRKMGHAFVLVMMLTGVLEECLK
jgi:hypothetical protein